MYLPSDDKSQRESITNIFKGKYCPLMKQVGDKVSATSHWAKLELPSTDEGLSALRENIQANYPVVLINKARKIFDPKGILSNSLIEAAFGTDERK